MTTPEANPEHPAFATGPGPFAMSTLHLRESRADAADHWSRQAAGAQLHPRDGYLTAIRAHGEARRLDRVAAGMPPCVARLCCEEAAHELRRLWIESAAAGLAEDRRVRGVYVAHVKRQRARS